VLSTNSFSALKRFLLTLKVLVQPLYNSVSVQKILRISGSEIFGPGLFNLVENGWVAPKPKFANGLEVPKKFSNISWAFCL
jgi:hypothetical protein